MSLAMNIASLRFILEAEVHSFCKATQCLVSTYWGTVLYKVYTGTGKS